MRTLPTFVASGLLLGVLAGCGSGDPEPKLADPTPSPVVTSSPTAPNTNSATSTLDPVPESADDFIARWQSEVNAMQATGDTKVFRSLTLNCASCDALANHVADVYAAGGFIRTDGSEVVSVVKAGAINGWPTFDTELVSAPGTFKESADSETRSLTGGRLTVRLSLESRGSGWLVRRYSQVAQ